MHWPGIETLKSREICTDLVKIHLHQLCGSHALQREIEIVIGNVQCAHTNAVNRIGNWLNLIRYLV